MRRDTLSGFVFILVGNENDVIKKEISELGLDKLKFDTTLVPNSENILIDKYRFVTDSLFRQNYFSADYLFKWDDNLGNSFGISKNIVYNSLRKGEHLVCSLSFDVVKAFVNNRQVPKKNYILINVSLSGDLPMGFDEYSFDLISTDVDVIKKFILRHL